MPPAKQGDYAYLLHILRSLKSTGKGACILPHGVLFRGNAEAVIRKNLVQRATSRASSACPPTSSTAPASPPASSCSTRKTPHARKGIFMIDASKGFMKDGNKNRLREQDIHQIVDTFTRQAGDPELLAHGAGRRDRDEERLQPQPPALHRQHRAEDLQDIDGHLRGGIPTARPRRARALLGGLPGVRAALFADRPGYLRLAVDKAAIKPAIFEHPEFAAFIAGMESALRRDGATSTAATLKALQPGFTPKALIESLAEDLLAHFADKPLIDAYDVYQHLMDYWAETMQDDCYLIAADGWKAQTSRIIEKDKKGKERDKGWTCDLVPKPLIVARYFAEEQAAIDRLEASWRARRANGRAGRGRTAARTAPSPSWTKVNTGPASPHG